MSFDTDVLIIGAGPVGLTAANLLARYNIRFRILEKNAGPTTQSRAATMHMRTLELWDKFDFAKEAVAHGVKVQTIRLFSSQRQIAQFPLHGAANVSPYAYILDFEQSHPLLDK